jgi:hypothetical protein
LSGFEPTTFQISSFNSTTFSQSVAQKVLNFLDFKNFFISCFFIQVLINQIRWKEISKMKKQNKSIVIFFLRKCCEKVEQEFWAIVGSFEAGNDELSGTIS